MNKFIEIIFENSIINKYTKWYINIILKSRIEEKNFYTEKHHIVPKSFSKELNILDINDAENLVNLTPKEHYICHLLLTKMFRGKLRQKMLYAVHRLCYSNNGRKSNIYIQSRHYEKLRKEHSRNLSGIGNPMFGKSHSEETKQKISLSAKNRIVSNSTREKMSVAHSGSKNHMYGKTHTLESRRKISERNKGTGIGVNNTFYGKKHTEDTKQRLSEIRKNYPKLKCQHCEKMVDPSNHKRWHGENCKQKLL